MSEANLPISATRLAAHLACEHKTQLDRLVAQRLLHIEQRQDARLDALIERGERFEQEYVAGLRAQGLTVTELPRDAGPDAALAAMQRGEEIIVQAHLVGSDLHGYADVLRRVAAPSQLGDWSYEPLDTKLARETKATAILQLLTYAELLRELQGVLPERVHVVSPSGEHTYRTADFHAFHRLLTGSALAARRSEPTTATYPQPVPHCDVCNYWQHCDRRRRDDDHLSLVAGLGRSQQHELQRQGIDTVVALAAGHGELPQPPERGGVETYRRLGQQARLQVAARDAKQIPFEFLPLALDPAGNPVARGFARLPEPNPHDLFLDFEGDPFVGDGGLEYLTGWVDVQGQYRDEWAFDARQEKAAVETFLDAVAAARARDPAMHVYHFAPYEPAALKRTTQRHQTRLDLLDELLRAQVFVDLRAISKEALRIGVESYGLKQLEPVFGFVRELELQIAAKARQRLEIALELGHAETAQDEATRRLVAEYNRDDCVATQALRDWLEQRRAEFAGQVGSIPRPTAVTGEAKESVLQRQQRIDAAAAALRLGLPDEARDYTPEQQARALLANLCGYFLRETKCDWWDHYRLRELPPDERFDEREMIAGLEIVRTEPRVGAERVPRQVFQFPPQETAIEDEKLYAVRDDDGDVGWGVAIGTVKHCDLERGLVTIQRTGKSLSIVPTAVFREQGVSAQRLEDALLEFADHVIQHGLDGRRHWSPAIDLLQRRCPRLTDRAHGAVLVDAGETFADALSNRCLHLDGSTLPVQGPPGTGKSHTGALAILSLLRCGKTVGVTAVSHKVVLNLLDKVRALAAEQHQQVTLWHRRDSDELHHGVTFVSSDDANALPGHGAVLGGTAWTWASSKRTTMVDYLFVDEAGQMALPTVLAASRGAKNLVLLGDPMQLEQPRRGAHPEGADQAALVHLLDRDQQTLRPEQGIFLGTTWRMHPTLTAFTSELYYEGKLTALRGCARQRLDGTDGFDGAGLSFLPVEHDGNQARSDEEVAAVVALTHRLLRSTATFTDRNGVTRALTADDVLVVAPYNAQVSALLRALHPLGMHRVGTVDRFQGQEAPIVIYSCTSSSADSAPRGMTFLLDPHRFNVATSRAKARVIVVASTRLLSPECRTVEHLRMANGLCRFAELSDS